MMSVPITIVLVMVVVILACLACMPRDEPRMKPNMPRDKTTNMTLPKSKVEAARRRWEEFNREAREAGCKCGKPATHVRTSYGAFGGSPETYSCDDHVNVNMWSGGEDGTWTPCGDYDEATLAWVSPARRI
jgi:hypothetical protein